MVVSFSHDVVILDDASTRSTVRTDDFQDDGHGLSVEILCDRGILVIPLVLMTFKMEDLACRSRCCYVIWAFSS